MHILYRPAGKMTADYMLLRGARIMFANRGVAVSVVVPSGCNRVEMLNAATKVIAEQDVLLAQTGAHLKLLQKGCRWIGRPWCRTRSGGAGLPSR
jgi:hypothetical protein